MREQRSLSPWTIDPHAASDEDLLRAMFDLADEASCLQRRSSEIVLRIDHLATVVGERWAPEAMSRIEAQERAELEAEG